MKSGTTNLIGRVREICGSWAFQPYWTDKSSFGNSYRFWIGDSAAETWYSQKSTDSEVHFQSGLNELSFLFDEILTPDDQVFECGAHHGWTTLQLSRFLNSGSGKVHAFEPNRANFDILKKNLGENDCSNVVSNWVALSSSSGSTSIYRKSNGSVVPRLSRNSLRSRRMLNRIYGVSDVPTITIDQYVSQSGTVPSVLKIDVEGFEYEVLQGAKHTLATRPKIFLEIHTAEIPLYGGSVREVLDLLNLDGYKVWIQEDGLQSPQEIPHVRSDDIHDRVHLFALPL